jgi:hypothetical protein
MSIPLRLRPQASTPTPSMPAGQRCGHFPNDLVRTGMALPRRRPERLLAGDRRLVDGTQCARRWSSTRSGWRSPAGASGRGSSTTQTSGPGVREPRLRTRRAPGRDRRLDWLSRRRLPQRGRRDVLRHAQERARPPPHLGGSSSNPRSRTSSRSSTASDGTRRSTCSRRRTTNNSDSHRSGIEINYSNNDNQKQPKSRVGQTGAGPGLRPGWRSPFENRIS